MGRLKCCLLFAAMTLSLIKADEGWKRLMDLNTAQEHRSAQWARSSNHAGGNRVPFAPEDIAMPPPWLLPNQQPQVAFPVAQAQVRSFFEEEVVEWPPRSAKKSNQYVPEPSQHPQPPPQIIHTTLQPPRRQWTDTAIRPVQHIRFEADRPSTSQRPQAEPKPAPAVKQRDPAAVTQHVVDLKKIPPPPVAPTVDLKEPYRTVAEPKPEQHRRQNKQQQQTASRKSAISYDSSEYDYEEEAAAISNSAHQDKQMSIHSKMDESEGGQSSYDESPSLTSVDASMSVSGGQDDFYAKVAAPAATQRRHQFVQQFVHQPESRRQPQAVSTEEADVEQHQAFDYGKTIFRTQLGSGQVGRQHPHEYEGQVQQRENGRPSTYVDEATETERQQAAKAKQGQPGVRKQQLRQQQQQQPLERNTAPPEASVFEAERPSFFSTNLQASPNQRQFQVGQQHHQRQQLAPQQPAGDWPPRHPAPESNRKNKPRTPYRPEEQPSRENFVNVPKYKPSNPTVAPVQRYQEEAEDFQRDHQSDLQAPYHHQQQPYRPEEDGVNYGQPEEHHRPEENHRPEEHYRPKEHHRTKEHHQPIYDNQEQVQHGKKNNVRQRRPESRPGPESEPTQSNPWHTKQGQPEGNAYDPYEEQRQEPHREQQHVQHHHEPEQQHEQHQPEEPLPVAPIPGRRPPGGRPSFQPEEQFNGPENDPKGNNESEFEDSPPFVAPTQKRPQHPSPNRPRPHRPLPPPQRPRDASIVTQGLNTLKSLVGLQSTQQRLRPQPNPDARRPERHRRPGGRRPPHHPSGNSFDNGGEIGRVDQLDAGGDEFDAADLNNAPVQARHNVQPIKEEPMEHRSDPDDDIPDFLPPVMSSTESPLRITAPPVRVTEAPELPVPVSTTAAPEEPKSTLFPPFNKRVRPQPPSPAQTESKANAAKDSSAGQLRITSYKQRIEAMKERAKLREQLAQSKKDGESTADNIAEPVVPVSVTSTSTTTARPSTTRAKIPPRMPVRRPVTASPTSTSSTTESVPVSVEKSQETKESNYEQYKRRFKPKASANRPVKEEEPVTPTAEVAPVQVDVQEEEPSGRKNLFGKMPGSPFVRRRIQQKQQREEEERLLAEDSPKPVVKEEVVEMPSIPPRPNKRMRPGQFARTTTAAPIIEPSLDDEEESGSVLASPDQWPPTSEPQISGKTETSSMPKAEEEAESAKIELVSVASIATDKDIENPEPQPIEEEQDYPTHQQQSYAYESAGQPFLDKPDLSSERVDSNIEEKEDKEPVPVQEKPRHSFFTMATNDPILPIEELLNIRVRDNGKDM
ncbi:titin-like [Daphnia carinata]|uniref:titin-like n=1 Tax=Daphnia carinata TaxID=120202 RepID=UPI00257F5DE4|nr:titin-like [Daphnia carinata]